MKGYTTRQNGRWYAVVDARPQGKRTFHRAEDEGAAVMLLQRLLDQAKAGTYVAPSRMTVGQFARDWLDAITPDVSPNTLRQYEYLLRVHAIPPISKVRLTELSTLDIKRVLADLHGKLSPRTVKHVHAALRRMLGQAAEWGLLIANPAAKAKPPHVPVRDMQVWTPEQVATFLDRVTNSRYFAAYYLAITTGMRRGEVLGLRLQDIDFDAGQIAVRRSLVAVGSHIYLKEPKTAAGRRSVSVTPDVLAVLRSHRQQQLATGVASIDGLLFCARDGRPMRPATINRNFRAQCERAGLPRIRFHDLRHTHVSLLLALGANPKVIAERIGHTDVSFTLRTYAHLLPNAQREAAADFENLLATARQRIPEKSTAGHDTTTT